MAIIGASVIGVTVFLSVFMQHFHTPSEAKKSQPLPLFYNILKFLDIDIFISMDNDG